MQTSNDFLCVDCTQKFDSASELLKHFAEHVSADILNEFVDGEKGKKSNVPDLYPINIYRQMQDALNPLRFCEVTMEENQRPRESSFDDSDSDVDSSPSKFRCEYCNYACTKATLLRSHMKYHKHAKLAGLPDLNRVSKAKSRKQEKCNIKRKSYDTKLLRQSNELLCT